LQTHGAHINACIAPLLRQCCIQAPCQSSHLIAATAHQAVDDAASLFAGGADYRNERQPRIIGASWHDVLPFVWSSAFRLSFFFSSLDVPFERLSRFAAIIAVLYLLL
jgi:hypothetical protein